MPCSCLKFPQCNLNSFSDWYVSSHPSLAHFPPPPSPLLLCSFIDLEGGGPGNTGEVWKHQVSRVACMNESCRTDALNESCRTYDWVLLHGWMSLVARMNESCCTDEWVMSHVWISRVTLTHWMSHMLHVWMSYVARINESCRTYEWVMSHVWICHVARMNESCHTSKWVMSHV